MSYIEKMCFVNWRFRSFVQYNSAFRKMCVQLAIVYIFLLHDIDRSRLGEQGCFNHISLVPFYGTLVNSA